MVKVLNSAVEEIFNYGGVVRELFKNTGNQPTTPCGILNKSLL